MRFVSQDAPRVRRVERYQSEDAPLVLVLLQQDNVPAPYHRDLIFAEKVGKP